MVKNFEDLVLVGVSWAKWGVVFCQRERVTQKDELLPSRCEECFDDKNDVFKY